MIINKKKEKKKIVLELVNIDIPTTAMHKNWQ
jgi:hypothetical protein